MDRRDLLSGISGFFSDSIVLPPGDFDKELLLPIIKTAKMKKDNANYRSTELKNQNGTRSNNNQNRTEQSSRKFNSQK